MSRLGWRRRGERTEEIGRRRIRRRGNIIDIIIIIIKIRAGGRTRELQGGRRLLLH